VGPVPLAIPMGVRNDDQVNSRHERAPFLG
jgi:hypothetical protein